MNNKITIAKFYLVTILFNGCLVSYLLKNRFELTNTIIEGIGFLCICIVAGISIEFLTRKFLTSTLEKNPNLEILDERIISEKEQLAIEKINLYFNKIKFSFYFSFFALIFLIIKNYA